MPEQIFDACTENLPQVNAFVCEKLESWDCSMRAQMQLEVAVEELFVNIASYAYPEKQETGSFGRVEIAIDLLPDRMAEIVFKDSGIPYNPLEKPDPDVTKPAEERPIGGLGIYLVKKSVDEVRYCYENGQNILTIRKKI